MWTITVSEVPQCVMSTEVFAEPPVKRIKSDTSDRLLSPREAMIVRVRKQMSDCIYG